MWGEGGLDGGFCVDLYKRVGIRARMRMRIKIEMLFWVKEGGTDDE